MSDYLKILTSEVELLRSHLPNNFFKNCLNYESIFHINIPKTGTTFLNGVLRDHNLLKSYTPPHGTCSSLKLFPDSTDAISGINSTFYPDSPGFKESLKIAIIRNPYDWLVSFYFHENLFTPEKIKKSIENSDVLLSALIASKTVNVEGVGSLRKLYKTFEEFVYAYADPDAYWPAGLIGFKNFLPFQIFDDDGNCQADYCLRNETLSLSTYSLLISMGIPIRIAQKVLSEDRKNISQKRLRKDYRTYYNENMVLALEEKFKIINKYMNYDFENRMTSSDFIISLKNLNYFPINNRIV